MRGPARALAVCLVLGLLGCSGRAPGPGGVVDRYLQSLARDPVRSLALVSDDFQLRHGLRFEDASEAPSRSHAHAGEGRWRDVVWPTDPAFDLSRARLGWLAVLSKPAFATRLPRLAIHRGLPRVTADRAEVPVEVVASGAEPVAFVFRLVRRSHRSGWRIDAIERDGPARGIARIDAFLVAPDAEGLRLVNEMLERRRERR